MSPKKIDIPVASKFTTTVAMDGVSKEFGMIKLVWEGPGAREDQNSFGRITQFPFLRYEVQTNSEDWLTYFDC